ncbi:hypothetical protein [Corynebacterium timonense]|uniref:hypothetical protein n=1 Tax=Corynebacterium timonense TaxID=441500 RepID=UPI001E425EBD|nr:hypothetical protein [Corynebacterium timonense]
MAGDERGHERRHHRHRRGHEQLGGAHAPEALGQPTLSYATDGNNKQEARPLDPQESGVNQVGLDLPLGPGATTNLKYPFDVAPGNLWDAEFSIGNVTFEGNLNN